MAVALLGLLMVYLQFVKVYNYSYRQYSGVVAMLISATAITCPPLSKPTNGSVSYSNVPGQSNTYAFNVMATYSCDTGFSLVDNNSRTCTGDGSSTTGAFVGEAPTCEGECMKNIKPYSITLYTYSHNLPSPECSCQWHCDLQC